MIFWPGFWSPDSLDQWTQTLTYRYSNQHPVAHTLSMQMIRIVCDHPAAFVVFQMLLLWTSLLGVVAGLWRTRDNPLIWYTLSLVLALNPALMLIALESQKDVLFTALLLIASFHAIRLLETGGAWIESPRNRWAWILVHGLLASLRSYYFLLALGMGAWWLCRVSRPHRIRKIIALLAGVLLVQILCSAGLKRMTDAEGARYTHRSLGIVATHLMGGLITHGVEVAPNDWALLDHAMEREGWKNYEPDSCDPLVYALSFDQEVMLDQWSDWMLTAARMAWAHPALAFRHLWGMATFTVSPVQPDGYDLFLQHFTLPEDGFGWRARMGEKLWASFTPLFPELNVWGARCYFHLSRSPMAALLLRPALYLYLFFFGLYLLHRSRRVPFPLWPIALPTLLHAGILIVALPANQFRYFAPLIVVPLILCAWIVARLRESLYSCQKRPECDTMPS